MMQSKQLVDTDVEEAAGLVLGKPKSARIPIISTRN